MVTLFVVAFLAQFARCVKNQTLRVVPSRPRAGQSVRMSRAAERLIRVFGVEPTPTTLAKVVLLSRGALYSDGTRLWTADREKELRANASAARRDAQDNRHEYDAFLYGQREPEAITSGMTEEQLHAIIHNRQPEPGVN